MIIVGIIGKLCNDVAIHIILLTYHKLWVMPCVALIVIIDINISLLFFCKSTLFFCLIGPISECRAQKTLILSCLFDNEAVFTESKLPVAIIFACLSEFTSELEKDCLTLPVLLIEQVHSKLFRFNLGWFSSGGH